MLTRLAKATAAAIRTFRRRLQARYEGAQPGGGRRSYIPAFLQDARFDADGATRSELVRKSRYFERNSALMNAFCDRFEQFTVGSNGLQLTPASTDEEWNLRATEWWSEWCQFPDLTSKVCAGVGISKLLIFPWSIQGTVARADFDIANAFFRSRSAVMISILKELWIYVIGLARFQDKRVADAPHDWTKVTVQPPRAVNVDVGRNSAAMLAELEAGATTYEDVYGPLGKNWRERIRQRAAEESYLDQVACEFGVSPERIRKAIGETLRADMEAQAQEREKEETVEAQPHQRLLLVPASMASFGATRRVNFSNRHSKSRARAIAVRHCAGTLARP